MKFTNYLLLLILFWPGIYAGADTVTTTNGATLVGQVIVITADSVTLDTEYAGVIIIDAEQIDSLITDIPISSRLNDGSEVTGVMQIKEDGIVTIKNETMDMRITIDELLASWIPDQPPPKEAGYPQPRHWQYNIGADFIGKQGNSEDNSTSMRAAMALVSDDDELKFYASMDKAESNGMDTSDEIILGASYVSYLSDSLGWYVNTEFERDSFENIDLRTTISGGLSYWVFKQPWHTLELQVGSGYRHESFEDGSKHDIPIMDISLHNAWQLNSALRMTNNFTYSPSISDFNDYLLEQDSGLNMPLGDTDWSLRLGLRNNYKNLPANGIKRLDTTYYTRLMVNFF